MQNTIRIHNLTYSYKGQSEAAISNLTSEIPCEGIVAIIGESGSGKSTLLRLISGVYRKSDEWSGYYNGEIDVNGHKPHMITSPEKISLMAQTPFLLNHLTVKDNILLPNDLVNGSVKNRDGFYEVLIKLLDFSEKEHLKPMELSGGMKTRVAFARAMMSRPEYLYLDEPFTSLDILMRWSMYKTLKKERSSEKYKTFLTTHDLWEACILANWIVILRKEGNKTYTSLYENTNPEIEKYSIAECLEIIQPSVEKITFQLEKIKS